MFIIPKHDIQKKTPGCEKGKNQFDVSLKKSIRNINYRYILGKATKYYEIWMSY